MALSEILAKVIIQYHAIGVDITNCLGQLHLISEDEWNERNKNHVMALIKNPQINKAGLFLDKEKYEHS